MATTSQVVTSQLPTAFEEFYKTGVAASGTPGTPGYQPEIKGLIPQAFGLYGSGTPAGYQANIKGPLEAANLYTGAQRVQGLTPGQTQVGSELTGMRTPSQFGAGTAALQQGTQGLVGLLNQQAQTVSAPFLTRFQLGLPDTFGTPQAQQYMSPYMQNVVEIQQRKALEDAQKTQLGANLGAVRQGTYGGARQLLAQTEREKALGQQLGDIQGMGLQKSFEQAQQQFERDRAAQQQTAIQNLQASLGVQQLGAGQSLEAQRANQAAALQAAQQRQQAALGFGTLGSQFGQLGVAQQAADIDRLKTLGAYGDYERAVLQQQKDIEYQNMMQRIQYPEQQLEKLSGFIRGIPLTDTTTQTVTPPPSFASQLAGLGLSGLSLYNLMGKS
jgi:hypothetical protein